MPSDPTMMTGMALAILAWAAGFAACTGLGLAVFPIKRQPTLDLRDLFLNFWAGWGLLLLYLQIWHLFAPVDITTGLVWAIIGGFLLWFNLKKHPLKPVFHIEEGPGGKSAARLRIFNTLFKILSILLILWIANRAMGPLENGDSGLYHLGSVRWNNTYPIIPGLGNLHTRFGYNSSFFLYSAIYEPPNWMYASNVQGEAYKGYAYHFANGLLLVALTLQLLSSLQRLAAGDPQTRSADLFQSVFVVFLPYLYYEYASSLSNDLAIFSLGLVLGSLLCRLVFDQESPDVKRRLASLALMIAAAGVSLKLSFLAIGGLTSLAALAIVFTLPPRLSLAAIFKKVWSRLVPAAVLLIWVGRGYILTGYPAFPSTFGGLPVEWQVPAETAENESRWIQSWGRAPHAEPEEVLGNWDWLVPKLKKGLSRFPEFLLPVGIFGFAALIFILRYLRRADRSPTVLYRVFLLLLPAVGALAFWFFSSPNIRFVGALFWWLAAAGVVVSAQNTAAFQRISLWTGLFSIGLFLALALSHGFWVTPGPGRGFIPAPQAVTCPFTTDSGLVLNVPAYDDRCWDSPLPCTPHPDAHLELLEPGDLGAGFRVRK